MESIESILARDHRPEEVEEASQRLFEALESGDVLKKREIEIAILARLRQKVKALLDHAKITQKGYEKAKSHLEQIEENLRPLKVIGKRYGYTPYAPTMDPVPLGANWKAWNQEALLKASDSFQELKKDSPATVYEEIPAAEFWRVPIHQSSVAIRNGEPLNLKAVKSIRHDKANDEISESIILSLDNPNFSEEDEAHFGVGNFVFERHEKPETDEWDMNDRVTAEAYRSQGVAPALLHLAEAIITKQAKLKNKPQTIVTELAQVDVLLWMLKEGYTAATPLDQSRIERLLKGDDDLAIVSAPGDEQVTGKRQWFVF